MTIASLPRRAVFAVGSYLRRHPGELLRAAKSAASLKVGLPVIGLLWLARELGGDAVPADLELEERSPGLFARASFEMMDTPLLGAATLIVESIDMSAEAILIDLRVEDISLSVTRTDVGTPVAALLQAGALDLSRPGDLISYMPSRPEMFVEARGNVITLDLMKHPKLSKDSARRLVALLVPFVGVESIRGENQHLEVGFSAFPGGRQEILEQFRKLF